MSSIGFLWATITWNLCGTLLWSLGWCFGLSRALPGIYLGFVLQHSWAKAIYQFCDVSNIRLSGGEIHIASINVNELVFNRNTSTGKINFNGKIALEKQRHFVKILDLVNGSKSIDPDHQ